MHAEANAEVNTACPRCGGAFHCGVNDSVPCACGTVRLDEATLRALRERYSSCLCLSCLLKVRVDSDGG